MIRYFLTSLTATLSHVFAYSRSNVYINSAWRPKIGLPNKKEHDANLQLFYSYIYYFLPTITATRKNPFLLCPKFALAK